MQKMLFISGFSPDNVEYDGVAKKVTLQIKTFKEFGYDVDFTFQGVDGYYLYKKGSAIKSISLDRSFQNMMKNFYAYANKNIDLFNEYDVIYIRYDHINIEMLKFLKKVKFYRSIIITELPTYTNKWYPNASIEEIVKFIAKRLFNEFLSMPIDYMLTFSEHKKIFGYQTINIENFVDWESLKLRKPVKNNTIDLLALAHLTPAHGYDKVIRGMAEYYSNKNTKNLENIKLHIVGDGYIRDDLEKLVDVLNLEKHVEFYGLLGGSELDDIFNICDIGIGALAVYRKGSKKLSELKIREYAARGLPFIYNADEPQLLDVDFAKKIPFDESVLNIDEIINFYNQIKNKNINEIREFAILNFDSRSQLMPVHEAIIKLKNERLNLQ
ncbi:glycosyltransferase [Acinetobacter sp. ANC 5584]